MATANRYDDAIAEELNKVAMDLKCERYPHETSDEFGFRLVALVEDAIDQHESDIAHLDRLRTTVKALL